MDTHVLENLVLKISNGDLEALEGLYRDYRHAVFTYSLHLLRDRSQAEDNTQDVFLQIWSKASTYRTGSNPAAWIMRMTHNMAIDRYRRSTRLVCFEELPDNESLMGASDEDRIADRIDLQTVLGMLEPKDRQIVLLKAVAGLPLKSVSQLAELPLSTVHWRYRRALRLLSKLIRKMEV